MFRPDPSGYSVDEVIAKLSDVLNDVGDDRSRARKLAEMIERLQQMRDGQGEVQQAGGRGSANKPA